MVVGEGTSRGARSVAWILVFAAITFLLALVGYQQYLPSSASWSDVTFRALNLLVLNFHSVPGRPTPLALDVARFAAHVIAGAALVLGLLALARSRVSRYRGARWRGHVVVLGSAPVAADLALAYGRDGRVVLVGEIDDEDAVRLRRHGILVTGPVDDAVLAAIVDRASRVIVAGRTDAATVREASRLSGTGTLGDATVHLLVDEPDLAEQLQSAFEAVVAGRLDVCCGAQRIATAVYRRYPPRDERTVAPAPVVIGDGAIATELVRQLAHGWHRPADPMEVLLLGPDPDHAADVADRVEGWIGLHTGVGPWSPRAAVRAVVDHAERNRPSSDARQRRVEVGPLVVVAGLDDATTFLIAAKVLANVVAARVVAVVDQPEGWAALEGGVAAPDARLEVLATGELLSDPVVIESDLTWRLAEELLADQQRWPDDRAGPLGVGAVAGDGLSEAPEAARARLLGVAAAAPGLLAAAGLAPTDRAAQLVLLPEELLRLADGLADVLGADGDADTYRLLVAASGLPALVARVGLPVGRTYRPAAVLTDDDVEVMAAEAHLAYVRRQSRLGNATGSALAGQRWEDLSDFARESNRAQVRDIPVKLAGAGRCLVAAGDEPPVTDWLTDDVVERLAEWEHRRWMYLHLLAGYRPAARTDHARREHELIRPYRELTEAQRELDRSAVRAIPALLAAVGFGTRPLDAAVTR